MNAFNIFIMYNSNGFFFIDIKPKMEEKRKQTNFELIIILCYELLFNSI